MSDRAWATTDVEGVGTQIWARVTAELSQAAVAPLAGVGQAYVSEVESGVHNVTLGTMAKLADAVGTGFVDLLTKHPEGP